MILFRPLSGQLLVYFGLFVSLVPAALQNVTVDDAVLSGAVVPQYLPSTSNWNVVVGNNCTTCAVKPDPTLAYDGTWHDATYSPTNSYSQAIQFSFTGSALYIFFIIANTVIFIPTFTDVEFVLDNGVATSTYTHTPGATTDYQYNVLVYANESLGSGQHNMMIQPVESGNSVLILFDYFIYTTDTSSSVSPSGTATSPSLSGIAASTSPSGTAMSSSPSGTATSSSPSGIAASTSPSGTATSTSPSGTATSTSPSPSATSSGSQGTSSGPNIGAIVGGAVGGIVLVIVSLLYYRRYKRRNDGRPVAGEGAVVEPFYSSVEVAPPSLVGATSSIRPKRSPFAEPASSSRPSIVALQPLILPASNTEPSSGAQSSTNPDVLELEQLRDEVVRLRELHEAPPRYSTNQDE